LAALGLLVVILIVAGFALLHSARFQAFLLRRVQQKASAALGTPVRMRTFHLRFNGINPAVDASGITIDGAGARPDMALLQSDSLHLEVTIASLLQRSWYVSEIRIQHPVVRVFVDNQGKSNLPPSQNPQKPTDPNAAFNLGIRHVVIEHGEVYFNDLKTELNADLHQFTFQSSFEPAPKEYSGDLSYRGGHVQLQNGNALPHDLQATFTASPQRFELRNAVLKTGSSQLSLSGSMTNYSRPKVELKYSAGLDLNEIRRALNNPSLPRGTVQLDGLANYSEAPDRPLVASLDLHGEARSKLLAANYNQSQLPIRNIYAKYSLSNGTAEVSGMGAEVLGGSVNGRLTTRNLAGNPTSKLQATIRAISLSQVQQLLARSTTNQTAIQGSINATADASWGKTMQDLVARADASLDSRVQPAHGGPATSLNGVVHALYSAPKEQLSITNSYIRAPQTTVNVNGMVSRNSALQIQMQSNQLENLERLARAFTSNDSPPLGLSGQATLQATVTGSTNRPQIAATLAANNIRVKGTTWKSLQTNIDANSNLIRLTNGELTPATQGRISFQMSSQLKNWAPDDTSPFQVKLTAANVNAAELAKAAGLSTPVAGTISADVNGSGTQQQPKGSGTIRVVQARLAGEPLRAVNLQFQANGQRVDSTLEVILPTAGSAKATVQFTPANKGYVANVQATGLKLDQIHLLQERDLGITGVLNITASGQGTLDNPQFQAKLEIPDLRFQNQAIQNLKLESTVANHVAQVSLDSNLLQSSARGHGAVQLTGDYPADVSLDTQAIPFAPLVALYAPSQTGNINGQTELHATLRGPLKNKEKVEAHVVIPQLSLNYKNTVQLAAASPIHADFKNGTLELQRAVIHGTDTDINLQARVPTAKDAPMQLYLKGGIDLRIAQLLSPDISSGGQVQFDIDSFGSRSDPNVQGQIRIVNASFATGDTPLGLQAGNGTLTLTRDRLSITQFQGKVGGGDVSASGAVVYRPEMRFDVGVNGKGIRMLYQQSVRASIDSNLALSGNLENATLRGRIGIDQISFTPDFDLVNFAGQLSGEESPPPTQGFSQNLRLDMTVSTPGGIDLASRTASLAGSANLQVHGTAAQPVILGRVNLSRGDLIFSGNRYVLQSGTVDFRNPTRTEPVLDMAVNTTISQYDIQMRFWGPADHLHTTYASNPSLPPSDIINLIAFGKTSEEAAANPSPSGALGAQSVLASQVSNQVTNRIEKLAGVSQLSIDPVLGDSQQSAGARIAVQQRVTSKIFVTFSTDVTATQREIVKFEYQLSPRTSFEAVRDQNGGFSFLAAKRKTW
jgi:translocation and assembly module TamB